MKLSILFVLLLFLAPLSCVTPHHEVYPPKAGQSKPLSSKTIVLIHGMYMTPKSWDEWKRYFEKAGYTVHAPPWPAAHSETPKALRDKHPNPELAPLKLDDIVASYRTFIDKLPEKPILIGHSMGGLIVQVLLHEKRGAAGVAVDSGPTKGVLSLKWSFLRSNWPVLSPFADESEPIFLDQDQFRYAFTNCISEAKSKKAYEEYSVPESRVAGKGALTKIAKVDYDKKSVPLLFVAGAEDNIIPASLNYSNFKEYSDSSSLTEFKMFENRCHFIVGQDGWKDVAGYISGWIQKLRKS